MRLPEKFLEKMRELLGDELEAFVSSYDSPPFCGLRANPLKISLSEFQAIFPFGLTPVPWAKDGFYFNCTDRPAKHPYYYAGLFYIQEPSAMSPVTILSPKPGEKVLDLCAAPGGKSLQIAASIMDDGLLVSNDSSPERVKALVKNLELWGIKNILVTNDTPDRLARSFPAFFDKILVDAPCSGEGMFRKDEDAARSWDIYKTDSCVSKQKGILKMAAEMLKPGGYILYSTCTFSPEENEGTIERFLATSPDFEVAIPANFEGFAPGRPEWINARSDLQNCIRLWPHKLKGEGHFIALLHKRYDAERPTNENIVEFNYSASSSQIKHFYDFCDKYLSKKIDGKFYLRGEHLFLLNDSIPELKGVRITRPGWYLGEIKKDRFEPSQAMALGIKKDDAKQIVNLASSSDDVLRYLKGETLDIETPPGWCLVCVDGYPLGWAKQAGGVLKNHYPKGWRWL